MFKSKSDRFAAALAAGFLTVGMAVAGAGLAQAKPAEIQPGDITLSVNEKSELVLMFTCADRKAVSEDQFRKAWEADSIVGEHLTLKDPGRGSGAFGATFEVKKPSDLSDGDEFRILVFQEDLYDDLYNQVCK